MRRVALTIAGSDSSGGAGLQADLRTFTTFGVYGATVVTAITAQGTRGVRAIGDVAPELVAQQLDAVLDDLDVAAAKTGMLAHAGIVDVVAARLRARPLPHLVVDPVIAASTGAVLLDADGVDRLRAALLPLATLVTPNLAEAARLTGRAVTDRATMRDAARALVDLGARAALVTGGHLPGDPVDVLHDGRDVHELAAPRVAGDRHGTGCTLSAAVTARLALGDDLHAAVETAKRWLTSAIAAAPPLGGGGGPLDHWTAPPRR